MRTQAMQKVKNAFDTRTARQKDVASSRGFRAVSGSIVFDFKDLDGKI